MRYIVMAMIMVLTCLDLRVAQAVSPEERGSLRGILGVEVVIEDIDQDAQADGLSKEAIRTAVELILRSSGIRVLARLERLTTTSNPWIYVRVQTLKDKYQPLYAVGITVHHFREMTFAHRPKYAMYAMTWENAAIAIVGQDRLNDAIEIAIEPKIKIFANDFLAANHR